MMVGVAHQGVENVHRAQRIERFRRDSPRRFMRRGSDCSAAVQKGTNAVDGLCMSGQTDASLPFHSSSA